MDIEDIKKAHGRIEKIIHRTGLEHSSTFSKMSGAQIYLKTENLQKAGSFKVRGAYNKIASLIERGEKPDMVIAASAGNHAQGVAFSATSLGIKSTIIMPTTTPIAKISATEGYGARLILHGEVFDDAAEYLPIMQKELSATVIPTFNDEEVIAGQGTIGLEILEDLKEVDTVIVPIGGGGLIAGVAMAIKETNPNIRIIGVQAAGADPVFRSFYDKDLKNLEAGAIKTMAEGIAIKKPGDICLRIIRKYVDEIVIVDDEEMAELVMLLLERSKMLVEPAGAASLAAVINKKISFKKDEKIVCILSGGNIDVSAMHRILERGLAKRSRMINFTTTTSDQPGGLLGLIEVVSRAGANIISVHHYRLDEGLKLHETKISISCEVGGREHKKKLLDALLLAGYKIDMKG